MGELPGLGQSRVRHKMDVSRRDGPHHEAWRSRGWVWIRPGPGRAKVERESDQLVEKMGFIARHLPALRLEDVFCLRFRMTNGHLVLRERRNSRVILDRY